MKMLYIGCDLDVYNFFKYITNRDFGIDIVNSISPSDAIMRLKEEAYGILIIDLPQENPEELFGYLKSSDKKLPLLFTGNNNTISQCHKYIKHHPLTSRVSYNSNEKVVSRVLERLLNISKRFENKRPESFCALPIGFFKINGILQTDVYCKNNQDKFSLMLNSKEKMPGSQIVDLMGAGTTHLYLKSEEFLNTTNDFMQNLTGKLKPADMKIEHLNLLSNFSHDSICKLIPEMGVKDEILEMASLALNNIKEVMARDTKLRDMAKNILKGKGYKSEHSLFLVFLTTAIVRESEWNSQDSINKLTLAAFFHDTFLEEGSDELALSDDNEKIKHMASGSFVKKYIEHPQLAVRFIEKIDGIPSDVEKIILEHHEKMDGTGFPRGIDWKRIFPLTAIFIVAEDFVNCIYEGGDGIEFINDVLDDLEDKYQYGHFKKSVLSLRAALALPRLPNARIEHNENQKKGA